MFATHDAAQIHIPAPLINKGDRMWQYVEFRLHVPWFHVAYKTSDANKIWHSSMLFLCHPEQLLELQQQTGARIDQVDLVSPGYINGTHQWKMESLLEIWTGQEPDLPHEQDAVIYVLANGNHYVNSALRSKEGDLLNRQLVFKI